MARLEDDLKKLNINISQSSDNIIKGINLLKVEHVNPMKIDHHDIKIISL